MRGRNIWGFIMMVLAVALLVTIGNWGMFRGDEVRAQVPVPSPFPPFPSADFKCRVINHGEAPATPNVTLEDQFDNGVPEDVVVHKPQILCAPASKNGAIDALLTGAHLKCYNITPAGPPPSPPGNGRVRATLCDQFSPVGCTGAPPETATGEEVQVQTAQFLCTLACKDSEVPFPECLTPPAP